MNRIEERFARLRSQGRKGLVVYIGAGDPDLATTKDLVLAFDKAGVAVVELGVPFSDPLADGLVNQLSAQRGLESGTTPGGVLKTVQKIREESLIPIVLYVYFNLIHKVGLEIFIRQSAQAGVDGLLILDLPPEESEDYEALMKQAGLSQIYLVAPTTPDERVEKIVRRGSGFIYCISREGVTGMQSQVAADLAAQVSRIRAHTQLPVAVGFGVSNADQARLVARHADAVVVGSAIVQKIATCGHSTGGLESVAGFVQNLVTAVAEI